MRCEEFELAVQEWTDGNGRDEQAIEEHARGCAACRELWHGLVLLPRALQADRIPPASPGFLDRVIAAGVAQQAARLYWRRTIPRRLAALAATLLVAASAWAWYSHGARSTNQTPAVANNRTPAAPQPSEDLLFPEWSTNDHPQDGIAIVEAAEPLAQALRDLARSIGSPVRPIANATSQAVETFFNDFPDADVSMMPGMREMMPAPMKKNPMQMRPSS